MPVEQVVKHTCARCHKVSYIAASPGDGDVKSEDTLTVMFAPGGTTVPGEQARITFDVLCEGCTSTVANYLSHVRKEPKKKEEAASVAKEGGDKASSPSRPNSKRSSSSAQTYPGPR